MELTLTAEELAYPEGTYVLHALTGVMAQNTASAAKVSYVWSTNDQKSSDKGDYTHMKRTISLCLILALSLILTACGSPAGQTGSGPTPDGGVSVPAPPEASSRPEAPTPAEDPETSGEDDGTILIAYFSATNNTEGIADHLDAILDADLYEIVPETPYTSDDLNYNDPSSRSSREMDDPNARPAISGGVENMEQYGVIFLGYPIWWGEAPRIVNTFLESYDLSGKTIAPFCTSGSSGIGSSAAQLQDLTDGAAWLEGRRFSAGASEDDVQSWVDDLDLGEK